MIAKLPNNNFLQDIHKKWRLDIGRKIVQMDWSRDGAFWEVVDLK